MRAQKKLAGACLCCALGGCEAFYGCRKTPQPLWKYTLGLPDL